MSRLALSGVLVAVLGLIAYFVVINGQVGQEITSIAVLPFENESQDPDNDYFADGLSEELMIALGQVPDLRVAARASSFALKGQQISLAEIGSRLNVDAVLEGSVRELGNQIRISAYLNLVSTGESIWSQSFDGDRADLFELQDDMATGIMDALSKQLPDSEIQSVAQGSQNIEALEAYMKGRFFWIKRDRESLARAIEFFSEAIKIDPDYSRAHAGLADAYNIMGWYDYMPPETAFPLAKQSADRAIELSPNGSEAHNSLGYYYLFFEWDAAESKKYFDRAIELDPEYPMARQWRANLDLATEQFDEAHDEITLASSMDPLAVITAAAIGFVSMHSSNTERAIQELDAVLEFDPNFYLAWYWRARTQAIVGRMDQAFLDIEKAIINSDSAAMMRLYKAYLYALDGNEEEARALLSELTTNSGGEYLPPFELSKVYFAMGEKDRGYALLDQAFRDRSHSMVFLRVDPELKPYRDEDAFKELVQRVGFAPEEDV